MSIQLESSGAGAPAAPPIDCEGLSAALAGGASPVETFKQALAAAGEALKRRFLENEPLEALVRERARTIDAVILTCWRHFARRIESSADLVAVGGYGRGELHPQSDIDLLILLDDASDRSTDEPISRFLTFLWDIGLEVGHSVRTLEDCETQARADVTVLTALMETRLLAGPGTLFRELPKRIGPDRMWDAAEFFRAKVAEQQARHHHFHDTAYNLEPNVKGSPGGLRDIQTIGWLARRYLAVERLEDLVAHDFLPEGQLRTIGRAAW